MTHPSPCPRNPANPSTIPLDCRTELARDIPAEARPTPAPHRPGRTLHLAEADGGGRAVAPAHQHGSRPDLFAGAGARVAGFAYNGSLDCRLSASSLHVVMAGSSSGTQCIDDELLLRASILTTPTEGALWICFPAAALRRIAPAGGSGNRRRVDHGRAAAKEISLTTDGGVLRKRCLKIRDAMDASEKQFQMSTLCSRWIPSRSRL